MYSADAFATVTVSDSEQEQNIQQQDQLFDNAMTEGDTPSTMPSTPVYSELTHDGVTNVRYDGYATLGKNLTLIAGTSAHLYRIAYNVAQPEGEQSPLSSNPERSDAASFAPHFSTGESGSYAQGTYRVHRWTMSAGGRADRLLLAGISRQLPASAPPMQYPSTRGFMSVSASTIKCRHSWTSCLSLRTARSSLSACGRSLQGWTCTDGAGVLSASKHTRKTTPIILFPPNIRLFL